MSAGDSRPPPSEFHVAQQSRRNKLRVQQAPNSLDPIADLLHVRDTVRVSAAAMFNSSSMTNFFDGCRVPFVPLPPSAASLDESRGAGSGGFARSGELQQPMLVGEWASAPPTLAPCNKVYYHHQQLRQSSAEYTDGSGELHFANRNQELASVVGHDHASSAPHPCPWSAGADGSNGGNELLFLPSYSFVNGCNSRSFLPWTAGCDVVAAKPEEMAAFGGTLPPKATAAAQGLSLSLASNPVPELPIAASMGDRFVQGDCAGPSSPYPKFPVIGGSSGRGVAKSWSGAVDPRRWLGSGSAGPLGPFTGYAAILKSSKFSRPAQLLLEEFCSVIWGSKVAGKQCEATGSERLFRASSGTGYEAVDVGKENSAKQSSSAAVSTSSLHSSTAAGGSGSGGSEACKVHRPEFQQKKATLLNLQEEVCRKYKQYHQQMQMVVSSFDSVSGLSSAAPYTSSALKSVSKNFRSLKYTITDQLQHVSKVLGEERISSPISSRGENMTNSQMKYLDQSLQKQKGGESSLGFMGHPQPVWRPQRGLPEQAVSVLRSWLFEHFLHPYPNDMDKHMLASQTGLSRNQVSNWFINARVRLWKPMVEEIHMLESKGMSRMDLNTANEERNADAAKDDGLQRQRRLSVDQTAHVHSSEPLGCSSLDPVFNDEVSQHLEPWHCDKRLRTTEDCGGGISPMAMDGDLVSFSTYHHQHAMGIAGAVSLSLGLRHEGGRQDSQQMGHFGTTMLHDFVS